MANWVSIPIPQALCEFSRAESAGPMTTPICGRPAISTGPTASHVAGALLPLPGRAVAGDLTLAQGGAGLVIAGGVGLRLRERVGRQAASTPCFTAKGRFESYMSAIPVKILTHPQPGLLGSGGCVRNAGRRRRGVRSDFCDVSARRVSISPIGSRSRQKHRRASDDRASACGFCGRRRLSDLAAVDGDHRDAGSVQAQSRVG